LKCCAGPWRARYEQYEISNFARPGWYARHNTNYWKNRKYLGVGPSAHSFNGVQRQFNVAHNAQYLKAIGKDGCPARPKR
jgi:oxygen-independent coproporphyrinogen-3 oxidase